MLVISYTSSANIVVSSTMLDSENSTEAQTQAPSILIASLEEDQNLNP